MLGLKCYPDCTVLLPGGVVAPAFVRKRDSCQSSLSEDLWFDHLRSGQTEIDGPIMHTNRRITSIATFMATTEYRLQNSLT